MLVFWFGMGTGTGLALWCGDLTSGRGRVGLLCMYVCMYGAIKRAAGGGILKQEGRKGENEVFYMR